MGEEEKEHEEEEGRKSRRRKKRSCQAKVVQLTVLSRLAGPIERWPETLATQAGHQNARLHQDRVVMMFLPGDFA